MKGTKIEGLLKDQFYTAGCQPERCLLHSGIAYFVRAINWSTGE